MSEAGISFPRPLRLGMVGGGPGSNIGATHRQAARLDRRYELVAGVFASDAERSRAFAATLGIDPARRYATWHEMAEREAQRKLEAATIAYVQPGEMQPERDFGFRPRYDLHAGVMHYVDALRRMEFAN